MIKQHDKLFTATVLLIVAVFSCQLWQFIPYGIEFPFLFFDETTWKATLNPIEIRRLDLKTITTPIVDKWVVLLYIPAALLVGDMRSNIFGFNYSLWYGYIFFIIIRNTDYFLTFGQTLYFRTLFIIVLSAIQVDYYLRNR